MTPVAPCELCESDKKFVNDFGVPKKILAPQSRPPSYATVSSAEQCLKDYTFEWENLKDYLTYWVRNVFLFQWDMKLHLITFLNLQLCCGIIVLNISTTYVVELYTCRGGSRIFFLSAKPMQCTWYRIYGSLHIVSGGASPCAAWIRTWFRFFFFFFFTARHLEIMFIYSLHI